MMLDAIFSAAGEALQAAVYLAALATLQEDCSASTTTKGGGGGGLRGGAGAWDCHDSSSPSSSQPSTTTTTTQLVRWLSYGNTTLADRVEESMPYAKDSDEANMYYKMWVGWAAVLAFCGIVSFGVWLAILLSKKANKSPFNYYLLYLLFPDWSSTLNCAVTCALNAAAGHYVSKGMCMWQSWYVIWGVSTNAWLNAVVMFEIHRMLKSSRIRKRYFPPTRRRVHWSALYVNLWTGFVATWGLYSFPWLPHETNVLRGLSCLPEQDDQKSTLFLWLCFMPCFMLIPYAYAVYVAWHVWKNNLLPPKGQRRFIAIYFFRIVCVFVVMWGPFVICFFVLSDTSIWVVWVGGLWGHLQTLMSAAVSALKPDVALALWQLLTCKYSALRDDTGGTSEVFRSGEFSLSSSAGALTRRRSSSAGGGSKPEHRTNAITDASFKKALEQFTKENPELVQEQHEGPALGKGGGDSEDEKDDDEKILQAVKALGGGGGGNITTCTSTCKSFTGKQLSATTRVDNVMRDDDDSDEKTAKRPTRTPSVGFAEPLEVERKPRSPDSSRTSPRRSFNRNPWRTSLRNSKDRHVHDDIEDSPPPATVEPQSRVVDHENDDWQEKDDLSGGNDNKNEIKITENEITAGVVGGAEADESELPVSPFENSPSQQQPPANRRFSDAQLRIIQEHLAASSRSLDPSSSCSGGASFRDSLHSSSSSTHSRNSASEHKRDGNGDDARSNKGILMDKSTESKEGSDV